MEVSEDTNSYIFRHEYSSLAYVTRENKEFTSFGNEHNTIRMHVPMNNAHNKQRYRPSTSQSRLNRDVLRLNDHEND